MCPLGSAIHTNMWSTLQHNHEVFCPLIVAQVLQNRINIKSFLYGVFKPVVITLTQELTTISEEYNIHLNMWYIGIGRSMTTIIEVFILMN